MRSTKKLRTLETEKVEEYLKEHFQDFHPDFPPLAYRYNPASIRVRVVSDLFRDKSRGEREDMVLPLIRKLPKRIREDITILLLLPPEELTESMMNLEFEHPSPSAL